jgi:SAM-dependent methyltransferase
MNLRRIQHKVQRSLVQKGAVGTAAMLFEKALRRSPRHMHPPKDYVAVHPFDQQFGVETSGLLFAEDLPSGTKKDLNNNGYFGIAPSAFRQILHRLPLDFERFHFIDLGSGKGRALLIASEYPFRSITGVELSPKLHAISLSNLAAFTGPQRCKDVRSVRGDATEFTFPSGPLVVYLWNSFDGPVFTAAIAHLEASLAREPREIYILYVEPNLDPVLEASSYWRKLWRAEFKMSDEDYAASAFPPRAETCSAYCSLFPGSGNS